MNVYTNIRKLRLKRGLSQTDLAMRIGYSDRGRIPRIEKGLVDLSLRETVAIAEALEVDCAELLGVEDAVTPRPPEISEQLYRIAEEICRTKCRHNPRGMEDSALDALIETVCRKCPLWQFFG